MNPYIVTIDGKEYDVDAPDENTAWSWANMYHSQQAAPQQSVAPPSPPQETRPRTPGEFIGDTWASLKSGAATVAQAGVGTADAVLGAMRAPADKLYEAIHGKPSPVKQLQTAGSKWAGDKVADYQKQFSAEKSAPMQESRKDLQQLLQREDLGFFEGLVEAGKRVGGDPALLLDVATESLPSMAAMVVTGRHAATSALQKALVAGATKPQAVAAATSAALASTVGFNGILSGGSTAADVLQEIRGMPEEALQNSPGYLERRQRGMSHEQAREELAREASMVAGGVAGTIAMIATRIMGGGVETQIATRGIRSVLGKTGIERAVRAGIKGGTREAGEELAHTVGEDIGEDIGAKFADQSKEISPSGARAGLGLITGAAMGTAGGAMFHGGGTETQTRNVGPEPITGSEPVAASLVSPNTDKNGREYKISMERATYGAAADTEALSVKAVDPETGEQVAWVDFDLSPDGVLRAGMVQTNPNARRLGIAEMLYRSVRARGFDIAPGPAHTNAGRAFVAKMIAKGIINVNTEGFVVGASKAEVSDTSVTDERIGQTKNPDFTTALTSLFNNGAIGQYVGFDPSTGQVGLLPMLQFFRKVVAQNKDLGPLWTQLTKLIEQLPESARPELRIVNSKHIKYWNNGALYNGNGVYYARSNRIELGRGGMNARTIMHELIHALTMRYMAVNPDHPAVKKLESILKLLQKDKILSKHYGTLDVYEMMSEAMTSSAFQRDLYFFKHPQIAKLVQGARNAFDAIIESVRELLGITTESPGGRALLGEILANTTEIMNAYAADARRINLEYKKRVAEALKNEINASVLKDPFGLGQASKKVPEVSNSPLAGESNQVRAFNRTAAGMDLIPTDPDPHAVIEAARKESDISPGSALIGGKTMIAEIKNSSIIFAARDWFLNAHKRAQANIREFIRPAEQTMNRVLQNPRSLENMARLFAAEQKNGVPFTPEQLQQFGASERVINAYVDFREMMDAAFNAQNEARVRLGQKPLTRREAYIASRWSGNWRTPVYTKDGKLVWYIAETSKAQAEKALKYLAARDPSIDTKRAKIEFRDRGGKERGDASAGYYEMLRLLDKDDPRVAVLRSIYEEAIAKEGDNFLGQTKHHEPKAGIRGYVGDRPWMSLPKDFREMIQQQVQYAKNAFEWAEMQKAVENWKTVAADPGLQETHPNALALGQDMAKQSLGFGTDALITQLENKLAKAFRTSPQALSNAVGLARMIFYWTKLGMFNLPYTVMNIVQPLYTIPWHVRLSQEGHSHNLLYTTAASGMDVFGMILHDLGHKVPMTEIGLDAVEYGKANGLIDINPMSDVADLGRPAKVQAAEKIITANMIYAEKFARSAAFISFVHHLDQGGKFANDKLGLFKRAEELTNLSMVDYRSSERAGMFNKLGISGAALSTLQTFKINQYNQLYRFMKDAKQGNPIPMLTMLGIHFSLGGAMGMFLVGQLDDLFEELKEWLPPEQYAKVKDWSVKGFIIENMSDFFAYGGASKLSGLVPGLPEEGVNLSSRFDAGTVVDVSMEGFLPFAADLAKQGQLMVAWLTDPLSPVARDKAIHAVAPSSLKGVAETMLPSFNTDGISGRISDPKEGSWRRTPEETTARRLAMTGLTEAKVKEKAFRQDRMEATSRKKQLELADKMTEAILYGKPEKVQEMIIAYEKLGGNPESFLNSLGEKKIAQVTTRLQRLAMKATTKAGAERYQRYIKGLTDHQVERGLGVSR